MPKRKYLKIEGYPPFVDRAGERYGKLLVVEPGEYVYSANGRPYRAWICHCDCGNVVQKRINALDSGPNSRVSCGCNRIKKNSLLSKYVGDISGSEFSDIKKRARQAGLEFDLTAEYLWDLFLSQERRCRYTKWELTFNAGTTEAKGTSSLDRIDSSKGYIPGNVQWVHKYVNRAKLNYSEDYFISLCKAVVEHHALKHDALSAGGSHV